MKLIGTHMELICDPPSDSQLSLRNTANPTNNITAEVTTEQGTFWLFPVYIFIHVV